MSSFPSTLSAALVLFALLLSTTASTAAAHRQLSQQVTPVAAPPLPGAVTVQSAPPSLGTAPPPTLASAGPASSPANCTPPRSAADTMRPFCFVPETVSPQARQVMSVASAGGFGFVAGFNNTLLSRYRQIIRNFGTNSSIAAKQVYLQATRNDTLSKVPVVFGYPKSLSVNATNATNAPNSRLLIYLHGGGFFGGSCHYLWATVAPTAAKANLTALCIEYRLAPEHPFPAGLTDILAVYKTLLESGYQGSNMVVLGDSAGGGLVASLAIELQVQDLPLPAALGMFSPAAELGMTLDSAVTMIGIDPVLPGATLGTSGPSGNNSLSLTYVGGNTSLLSHPLVSPVRADYTTLFAGRLLPPTLIQVGLRETLLSDAVLLYHKMKAAAPRNVFISPYDAMWHVFQGSFTMPEAQAAHQEMAAFFLRALNGTLCSA